MEDTFFIDFVSMKMLEHDLMITILDYDTKMQNNDDISMQKQRIADLYEKIKSLSEKIRII